MYSIQRKSFRGPIIALLCICNIKLKDHDPIMIHLYYLTDMDPSKTTDCQAQQSEDVIHWNPPPKSTSFFEGVEKLLEVWFSKGSANFENCDLRRIPR